MFTGSSLNFSYNRPGGRLLAAAISGTLLALLCAWLVPVGDTFFARIATAASPPPSPCCVISSLNTNAYVRHHFPQAMVFIISMLSMPIAYGVFCTALGVGLLLLAQTLVTEQTRSGIVADFFSVAFLILTVSLFEGISLLSVASCLCLITITISLHHLLHADFDRGVDVTTAKTMGAAGAIALITVLFPTLFIPLLLLAAGLIWMFASTRGKWSMPVTVFLLLCILIAMKAGQIPDSLNLPPYSRFVPGFGTNIGNDPLIGPPSERPFIDRLWVSHRVVPFAILATILLWLSSFSRTFSKIGVGFAVATALLLWQSSLVPTAIQVIGPIASASRIIPFVVFYPLEQIVVIGFILSVALFLRTPKFSAVHVIAAILPLYLLVVSQPHQFFGTLLSPVSPKDALTLVNSPSLHVIKERLPRPPLHSDRVRLRQKDVAQITASTNQDQLASIFDHNADTRWSTKPSSQSGGEWIMVRLHAPRPINGIAMLLPHFWGDYPRGVTIRGGMSDHGICNPQKILYQQQWWRGSVERFSNGLLGLSPESFVNLYFPEHSLVDCIKIEQTGRDDTFEWSVESITLLN